MNALDLASVTYQRGQFQLPSCSLQVAAGERIWISGPNGSGKSTLLSLIAGLHAPTAGTITIQGTRVDRTPPWQRPCTILLQDLGLWPHLTIRKQCTLAGTGPDIAKRIQTIAQELNVTPLLDRKPAQLSGGEAQRSALVRTLLRDTPLVLLDEPYAAQHEDGIAAINLVLDRLRDQGKAVIVAGHREAPQSREMSLAPARSS